MSVSQPNIYLKNDVARTIDDARFAKQMFKVLPPDSSFRVNAFRKPHVKDSPQTFKYVYPQEYNNDQELVYQTQCCNRSSVKVISGPKLDDRPLETATWFSKAVSQPRQTKRASTTR